MTEQKPANSDLFSHMTLKYTKAFTTGGDAVGRWPLRLRFRSAARGRPLHGTYIGSTRSSSFHFAYTPYGERVLAVLGPQPGVFDSLY